MRRGCVLTVVAIAIAVAGCGKAEPVEQRPGQAAVYDRIESLQDCAQLRKEIDNAVGNAERAPAGDPHRVPPLAYAQAAYERRSELGCE